MVIDVVTAPRSMPANRSSMSARVSTATPHRPTSPSDIGSSESSAHQRRQVEGGGQAVAAGREQLLEPPVGVVGGAEAGEHAHRPELRAVHRGVRAPGVGVLAGELAVVGAVHRVDRHPRHRLEHRITIGRFVDGCLPYRSVVSHVRMVPTAVCGRRDARTARRRKIHSQGNYVLR